MQGFLFQESEEKISIFATAWFKYRQVKAVLYVKDKGKITNSEYQTLNNVSKTTATRDLTELLNRKLFFYEVAEKETYIHFMSC